MSHQDPDKAKKRPKAIKLHDESLGAATLFGFILAQEAMKDPQRARAVMEVARKQFEQDLIRLHRDQAAEERKAVLESAGEVFKFQPPDDNDDIPF